MGARSSTEKGIMGRHLCRRDARRNLTYRSRPGEMSARRAGCRRPRLACSYAMTVTAPDLKAFLLATPFFGGLSDGGLDLLVSMLAERRFDSGATVVAEDVPGRSMFIVRPAC